MSNPRYVALIGLASAVAATALPPAPSRFEGTPRLDRPNVHSIIMRPDTVWFCARAYPKEHRTDFAFVRRTRKWVDGRRSARCGREPARPAYEATVLHPGRGITIRVARSDSGDRSYLVMTDSVRKRRIVLRPTYSAEQIGELQTGGNVDQDTVSTTVRDVIVNDSLVWIGLWGGFPEGEGTIGGVYRINRRTGAWRHIVNGDLSSHAVTGLAESRGTLWIATELPGEHGPVGDAGLLRVRTGTMRWDAFTSENSPLPDALIQDVAADPRLVAVATEKGLAVGDVGPRGDVTRWSVRHYSPAFIGDSLVMSLGERSSMPSERGEPPFIFVQRFAPPGRERALLEATRRADPDSLLAIVAEHEPSAGWLFADTSALPAIASLLAGGRQAQAMAADALLRLPAPPRTLTPVVRAAFLSIDSATTELRLWSDLRANLGRILNRSADSTAQRWARATLDRARRDPAPSDPSVFAGWNYSIVAAARILAGARDVAALDQVLGIAPMLSRDSRGDLLEPILVFGVPSAWQSALAMTDAGHVERIRFIDALNAVSAIDSASAPRITDLLVRTLADSSASFRRRAAVAARRARTGATIPPLLAALETSNAGLREEIYATLVSLTGRGDAPAPAGEIPRAADEWWHNLLPTSGAYPVVSAADGERALAEWQRRRRR